MSWRDRLALAFESLRVHRVRTVLTVIGIGIGVLAVLLLTALGEAARRYVTREFAAIGANLVMITPGRTETAGAMSGAIEGSTRLLTLEDGQALERRVPGVRSMAPIITGTAEVEYAGRTRASMVIGTTAAYSETRRVELSSGRFLPAGDVRTGAFVAVLGANVAREMFRGENPLGKPIRIGDWRLRVVGVAAPKGRSMGLDLDDVIYVPLAAAQRMFDRRGLASIWLRLDDPGVPPATLERIRRALVERHDGEEDFTLATQGSMLRSFQAVIDALTAALAGIAAISLAVAGIGIMNVMLVSVSERTTEVGLFKALGARRRQVLALFLVEAVLLSAWGTLAGVAVALAATVLAQLLWPAFPLQPEPRWIAGAVTLALAAGMLFGLQPARRAARLDPVEALRGRR